MCQHLCLSLPYQKLLFFSFDYFLSFVQNVSLFFPIQFCLKYIMPTFGSLLALNHLLSFSIPFFPFSFFFLLLLDVSSATFLLLDVYYANTWVPLAIYFLSATLYCRDIHTGTLYSLYEVICINFIFTVNSFYLHYSVNALHPLCSFNNLKSVNLMIFARRAKVSTTTYLTYSMFTS